MRSTRASPSRSQRIRRGRGTSSANEGFDAIDTDHSGVISRTELKDKLIKDDVFEKILRMKMDLTPRTMEHEMDNAAHKKPDGKSAGEDLFCRVTATRDDILPKLVKKT